MSALFGAALFLASILHGIGLNANVYWVPGVWSSPHVEVDR